MSLADLFRNEPDIVLHQAGDVIFSEGDAADAMFVIIDGEVDIRIRGVSVEIARSGDIVGEMALIDQHGRSATVIAVTAARLARIDRRRFLYLIQNTPTFSLDVMTVMTARLRRADEAR